MKISEMFLVIANVIAFIGMCLVVFKIEKFIGGIMLLAGLAVSFVISLTKMIQYIIVISNKELHNGR